MMEKNENKTDASAAKDQQSKAADTNMDAELEVLTDKFKRALADAENARKRADAARVDGREHGVALAVEALAPAFDDTCLAIKTAQASPDADTPQMTAFLEGLNNIKAAFETGLKALGVSEIAPTNTPFDPALHEAMQIEETDKAKAGEVLVLHRPGFALGKRLIRPAHVTVSASPSKTAKDEG